MWHLAPGSNRSHTPSKQHCMEHQILWNKKPRSQDVRQEEDKGCWRKKRGEDCRAALTAGRCEAKKQQWCSQSWEGLLGMQKSLEWQLKVWHWSCGKGVKEGMGLKQCSSGWECFVTGRALPTSAGLLWELGVVSGYCANTNTIGHLTQYSPATPFQILLRKRNLVNKAAWVYLTSNTYKKLTLLEP